MKLVELSRRLSAELREHEFSPPVAYVYRPLEYAREAHEDYLKKWGLPTSRAQDRALLLGMNPGPWGMAQTGVPFGAVGPVRDFLGIRGEIGRAEEEHPKRPVLGFECAREEISGARLWGFAEQRFASPEAFFRSFFVANYCPLLFLEQGARNLTPDKLLREDRDFVTERCDRALAQLVDLLDVTRVIGVGAWAEKRARAALEGRTDVSIARILHPSPASPMANRGWADQASRQLAEIGVDLPQV